MMVRAGVLLFATSLFIAAEMMIPSCSASAPASTAPPRNPVDIGAQQLFRSVVYQLYGNVYPFGHYYVTMNIGNPPKPYFLDIDTGSDLTWLHCDADGPCRHCPKCPHPLYKPPPNRKIPCRHRFCAPLPGHRDCNESPDQCDYDITYADGLNSLGVLIGDVFTFHNNNSYIAFGCGYDQQGHGMDKPSPVDGLIGLGSGPTSFVSQLSLLKITRNIIGHCLGRRSIGYLFFGDGLIPSRGVTWTPMKSIPNMRTMEHKYSPGTTSFSVGNKSINADLQAVFDTGSTYTYFDNRPYLALVAALRALLSNSPLKETKDPALPLCWKGPKPFTSLLDVKKYFLSLKLNFAASRNELEIPPENYLIITNLGNACLGILDGADLDVPILIGDISMQDMMMIYDNEKQQIGWARATPNCDRPPNSANTLLS